MPNNDTDTPRIYVAVLADYNNGDMCGEWIDATDADDMRDEIARILRTSKYPNVLVGCPTCAEQGTVREVPGNEGATLVCPTCKGTRKVASAEEYAIHDYDGFRGLGHILEEYCDLDTVAHAATMIAEYGTPWALWAADRGDVELSADDFQDAYCGQYDSPESYAEELAEECGSMPRDLSWPLTCIDWEAAARDLFMDGYTFIRTSGGEGHVYRDN